MTRANVGSQGRTANVEASGRATNSSASGPLAIRVPWRLVARSAIAEPWNCTPRSRLRRRCRAGTTLAITRPFRVVNW